MTDFDWYSPSSVEAATEGIRGEATKWYGFADTMETVAKAMAGMTLEPTAFAVIDVSTGLTMTDQHGAYSKTQWWLTDLFRDATNRFNELGDALKTIANDYERTDGRSAGSFDAIAKS
jgi:hypothetical protein